MLTQSSLFLETALGATPVLPVVTIESAEDALALAQALLRGGIAAMEITLRTDAALAAIRTIAADLPEMCVGVGTVLSPRDLEVSQLAGAKFAVSPGATPALLKAARLSGLPFLPGVATASEVMLCQEYEFRFCKFFPAADVGGVAALRALTGPFGGQKFCPTGGINLVNAAAYLALPNVVCVGGSWLTPAQALRKRDWQSIEKLAVEAVVQLRRKNQPADK